MKKITRAASAVLSVAFLAAAFAGCTKGGTTAGKAKKVEDNGKPFFSSEIIDFEVPEKAEDVIWYNYSAPVFYDGKFYTTYSCDTGNLESKNDPGQIHVFDTNGKLLEKKDLKSVTEKYTKGTDGCYLDTSKSIGSKFLLTTYKYTKDSSEATYYLYDFISDEVVPFDIGAAGGSAYLQSMVCMDDGTIAALITTWNDDSSEFKLVLTDGKKVTKEEDLTKKLEKLQVSYIYNMEESDGLLQFTGYGDKDYEMKIDYDLKSGELSEEEPDDAQEDYNTYITECDGVSYMINDEGIYRLGKDKSKEEIVLFENANVCVNKIRYSQLLSATDDEFVFLTMKYTGNDTIPSCVKLIKHDKNPNVGKELLVAASLTYMSEDIEESIVKFNNENDKVFIQIDRSYEENYSEYNDVNWNDQDAADKAQDLHTKNQADLVNQLAIDLIAGDGPDILFNCSNYSQLLKEDCLLDISDFAGEVLDMNDVFTNIIDGCKDGNGKILTIPLTFNINGIIAKKKAVNEGQIGFTYDQYTKFVKDKCNGDDILNYEGCKKVDYLESLLDSDMESFVHDGKADFDNEDFYALLEYVKSVPEIKPTEYDENMMIEDCYEDEDRTADYGWVSTFEDYCRSFDCSEGKSDYVLLGFPSSKATGPRAYISLDVAISASCGSVDSAKEFIKIITSKDYTKVLSSGSWSACISKSATMENAKASLDQIKSQRKQEHQWDPSKPIKKVSSADLDAYMKILGEAEVEPSIDLSIVMIIKEEAPAFFAGQKSSKEVAATINDRVQTVLNEKS